MKFYTKVLNRFDNFSGRATQSEYWLFTLTNIVILFAIIYIELSTGAYVDEFILGPLSGIFYLFILLPGLAVTVRRLHDSGKSGWWIGINVIPLLGAIVFFFFMATDGESGENQYGADPRAEIA